MTFCHSHLYGLYSHLYGLYSVTHTFMGCIPSSQVAKVLSGHSWALKWGSLGCFCGVLELF